MPKHKKIVYIIIDSFHPRALEHCHKLNKIPALSFLIDNGHLDQACISTFPTITPVCISTLSTGAHPSTHGIPGLVWYHRGERRIVDYGSTWLSIYKKGLLQVAQDFVFNLNHKQLGWEVKTIYEDLESRGFYTAAANPLIYRGNNEYPAHIPFILKLLTLFELTDMKIFGPKGFCLGQAYQPPGLLRQVIEDIRYWKSFGINDKFSLRAAQWFLQQKQAPDLLSVYLPDTDSIAHKSNADCCEPCLTRLDKKIASLLDCFTSWEQALEENIFILVGDHAQSTLIKGSKAKVRIPDILQDYNQAKIGDETVEDKDIAICSNDRMAYIYILRYRPGIRKDIIKLLLKEEKIDQIIWKEPPWYHIETAKGTLSVRKEGTIIDDYGNQWEITGEKANLDIVLEGNVIKYGKYPNALERIIHCLDNPNAGELVVIAKPGYILGGEGAPIWHGKGSHGSLHKEDSHIPLIISGASLKIEKPRLVDVVPYINSLLTGSQ